MLKNKELLNEEEHLDKSLKIIKKKIDNLKIDINNYSEELNEFRNFVWVDCKALLNSDDENNRLEFDFLLNSQLQKEYHFSEKKLTNNKLIKSYKSPYFGKIVFNNKDYYIGQNQISNDLDIIIYDWRAPVSSMFYDYTLGEAKYVVNDKEIKGSITQKRQFVIEDSKLKSAIENEQNIDDELLQEMLSKESTDKMSNIINTIQKEQNQVIRNLKDRVVVTEGVAGSGKTEIALHRIAYLLYHKKEYNSSNILILSPNNIFTDYISNVLPELSEENVLSTTFSSFAQRYIDLDLESYSNFLDRVYNKNVKINEFDEDYKDKIDNFLNNYFSHIYFKSSISLNKKRFNKEVLTIFLKKYSKLTIMERLNKITEHILGASHIKQEYFDVIKTNLIKMLNTSIDPIFVYNEFLKSINKKEIKEFVNYEHITPLLYTIFSINDYPENNNIKHVVIDEAQDYSKFQIYLLKKIFVGASFTILGDTNQNLNPYINYNSLKEYLSVFDEGNYFRLTKAYRSSKNIMTYATKLLNIEIDCFRDEGFKVVEKDMKDISDIINDLSKTTKRTALITVNKKDSEEIYNILSEKLDVSSPLFDNKKSKIKVLPVYIAKGLEFDSVIIYNASKFSNNLLYVASTRAQNNLIIYK